MLGAVGWPEATIASRRFLGGASLAVGAPMDCLYAATLVNEWACEAAAAELAGASLPRLESAAVAIRREIADDRDPALVALAEAAARRGVAFIQGDRRVSVGLGAGSLTWYHDELPDPEQVDWSAVHDVPLILVTGTNGKSTTVRLLAAMARAAGKTAGLSSSDWVRVGDEILDRGDYSGPGGARLVLRDTRVEIAVLELARGGILRRGLPVTRADAAIVTNIAADHLGEYGIQDADGIADAKLVVAKALNGGPLILNADDPRLVERSAAAAPRSPGSPWPPPTASATAPRSSTASSSCAATAPRFRSSPPPRSASAWAAPPATTSPTPWPPSPVLPPWACPSPPWPRPCARFGADEADNPGRGVYREIGGVKVLVDFAHNPHGVAAIANLVATIPATRRLVLLGQAGDRTDAEIKALAAAVWSMRPDRIVIKEMESYLRGREPGEIPALLPRRALPPRRHRPTPSPSRTARPQPSAAPSPGREQGDLLVLLSHAARARTLAFLDRLVAAEWRCGTSLPQS